MRAGLLFDADEYAANWLFTTCDQPRYKYDRCLGLVGPNGDLVGAVLYHNWNGSNVELSYYGEGTMSPGIVKCLARFAICTFDPSRLTVTIGKRKKRFLRSVVRLGFRLEGTQRCYYGKRDCSRNTGVRFVMFRERINFIAQLETQVEKVA